MDKLRSMVPNYTYQPLDAGSKAIRLLELLPAKDEEDEIHIKLRTVPLVNRGKTPYEALSYCWGSPADPNPVWCGDDSLLWVSDNLYLALCRLRLKNRSRLLWADAICINQSDNDEKSWQVQMMGDIYHDAERVLIWLGSEQDNSHLLPEFISQLLRAKDLMDLAEIDTSRRSYDSLTPSMMASCEIPSKLSYNRHYRALHFFTRRPWFLRVWVIQELALAREVTILCGEWSVSWDAFQLAWDFVDNELEANTAMDILFGLSGHHIPTLVQTRQEILTNTRVPFLELITRHGVSQATDPRDKIFALKELSANIRDLKVDYNKPVSQVFRDAAAYIIMQDQNLDILGLTRGSEDPAVPSWAPDWRVEYTCFPLLLLSSVPGQASRHNATRGSTYVPVLSDDGSKLRIQGQRVDSISLVGPPCTTLDGSSWGNLHDLWAMGEWARICGAFNDRTYELTGEPTLDVLRHVRHLGARLDGDSGTSDEMSAAMENFESRIRIARFIGGPPAVFKWLPSRFLMLALLLNLKETKLSYYKWITSITSGRAMIKTERGFIGLASGDLAVGDTVFLLAGGRVPYVLRERQRGAGNEFTLVGDCFLHGFLDGMGWNPDQCQSIWLN